ncbi:Type IV fimbrial assembly, ATPase PilB, partial [hydrothermal vent metagenome]
MSVSLKDKLIQTLIESESISQKDIDDAIRFQKKNKIGLDKALVEKGLIKEEDLLMLLVRELNIPFINLSKYKIDSSLMDVIPEKIARQYGIVPLSALDKTMTVAISDPFNVFAIDDLKNLTGKEIDVVMSTNEEILKAISAFYGESSTASFDEIREDFRTEDFEIVEEEDDSVSDIDSVDESEKAPIIRMVNLIIRDALKQRASDIHMEPMEDSMRVRYRVDGVLRNVLDVPKESQNAVIVRIKIMSRLDITSSMIPQDGRFKLKSGKKEVDFRVSLLPTTHGQKVVMRVLDKANLSVGLGGLGLTKKALDLVDEAIKKPFGMILVTGPTGSGKSTTLY